MRPPRYHFPVAVRSATRDLAARTVRAGTVAQTPEELEAWIAQAPDLREPLEDGGYTTEFTAGDLFPLYEVMVEQAGGPARVEAAPPSRSRWSAGRLTAIALAIAAAVALVLALG